MIEVACIRGVMTRYAPFLQEDEDVRDYLESLLLEEDSYHDLETLTATVQSFLNDDQATAEKLVQSLVKEIPAQQQEKAVPPPTTLAKDPPTAPAPTPISPTKQQNAVSPVSSDPEAKQPKKQAAARKEKRQRKPQEKKQKKKGAKINSTVNPQHEEGNNIRDVVQRLKTLTAQEMNALDDYSSAWEEAKQKVKENGQDVIWGGRGFGGRGVNRGLGVYRGKDAVVHNLTLSYGGRDLLYETHLAISQGHRYGLMGPNGVGKSTLLRRIASGEVPGWPMHLTVQMVEQEVLAVSKSVVECMQEISRSGRNEQKKEKLQAEIAALEALLEDPKTTSEEIESTSEQLSELYDQSDALENENNSEDEQHGKQGAFSKVDARAKKILKGLQFKEDMLETPGNVLSGGWRMRLALAQALYNDPDILLLDEPTNHLDLSAILFLEQFLVNNNMTVLVVSHDGHFLDVVCTDMIKFDNCKLRYHVGNYSSFMEMEEQTWARNTSKADAVARQEKKAMEFIRKQRSMANSKHRDDNKQRQAAERAKKLGRIGLYSDNGQKFKLLAEGNTKKGCSNRAGHIFGTYTNSAGFQSFFVSNEQVAFGEERQLLNFKFPAAPPLKGGGTSLITMEDCRFRYPSADSSDWFLQDVSLNLSYGSRVAIVGKNGAGKSTLLNILCGELSVNGGEFHRHPNLKIAHIAQHHIEQLGNYLESTPVEYFMQQGRARDEQDARQFLGGFGIVGPLAVQLIGTLSGGQKARLVFATVVCEEPQLLVLDEPTNHLDSDSLRSLCTAVTNFEGAVVIVSHNQNFMSCCAKEMWTVHNGRVKVEVVDGEVETFDDAFERYKESLRKDMKR